MYRQLIQTERLTPQFCMEVILNDAVAKSEDDSCIGEGYILKYQSHITERELDIAYQNFQIRNKKWHVVRLAMELTREEKILLLERKHKRMLDRLMYESRHARLRKMIRKMREADWIELLQDKIYYY
jgi:hypothetical protein